ncbi:hypothetical protein H4582DRAFT_1979096, partial [Lactarius indigo]
LMSHSIVWEGSFFVLSCLSCVDSQLEVRLKTSTLVGTSYANVHSRAAPGPRVRNSLGSSLVNGTCRALNRSAHRGIP